MTLIVICLIGLAIWFGCGLLSVVVDWLCLRPNKVTLGDAIFAVFGVAFGPIALLSVLREHEAKLDEIVLRRKK